MGEYKAFDQALFDENDTPARWVLKWAFEDLWGLRLEDNPDIYGPDLMGFRGQDFCSFVELEVKHNWKGEHFPFEEIHFLGRKRKFLNNEEIIFVFLNSDLSAFIWFTSDAIKSGKLIQKRTKLTQKEDFISLDVNMGRKVWIGDQYARNARITTLGA